MIENDDVNDYSDQSFDENDLEEESPNDVHWSGIEANNRHGQTRKLFDIAGKMKRALSWIIEELLERRTKFPLFR